MTPTGQCVGLIPGSIFGQVNALSRDILILTITYVLVMKPGACHNGILHK